MRPAEFSNDQIIQAGQDLIAVGRNITGFALRQKLGGGTTSRLKQVWDEHLSSQAVVRTTPVADLPFEVAEEVAMVTKALTERLAALAVELNDKAIKAAERRVSEVARSAGEQRAQAERELADAAQTVDDLELKLDQATADITSLERKLADAQAINQEQAVELARQGATLEAQCAMHKLEVEQLRADLVDQAQARKEVNAAREDAAQLRGQVEALQSQSAELVRAFSEHKTK